MAILAKVRGVVLVVLVVLFEGEVEDVEEAALVVVDGRVDEGVGVVLEELDDKSEVAVLLIGVVEGWASEDDDAGMAAAGVTCDEAAGVLTLVAGAAVDETTTAATALTTVGATLL